MTSPLRRKRPITVRVPSPAWTACSLIGLLVSGMATAQTPTTSPYSTWPAPAVRLDPPARTTPTAAQPKQPGRGVPPEERGAPLPDTSDVERFPLHATINLEPPGLEVLAQSVQSDEQLFERIRQENRERSPMERVVFPPDPVLSRDTYHGRKWDPMKLEVAPYYVCHGRVYFQQLNFERYGWGLGVLTPLVSGLTFLWDFVTFPYQLAVEPCRCFEYNTGWCLPGDPVPLLLYPPELSPTGFVTEVGTILALVAIFP